MIVNIPTPRKIKTHNIVVIILATIFSWSCDSNITYPDSFLNIPQNKIDLTYHHEKSDNQLIVPLRTIFEENNIEYISLQPNEKGEGLLVMPATIYSIEQNWLVYDPRNKRSSALLFDQQGQFIRYIGSKGNGPGEYITTSLCKINRYKRRIEIVDGGSNKILFYDFAGDFIKSIPSPLLFTDFIPDPYEEGYYLFTLDNFNTGYMKDYGLENDYVITKTDSIFQPLYGIEEINLNPSVNPFRNNGNRLFLYENSIGFINNYSNDLYLIDEDGLKSLISFKIDGIEFKSKEYIKNADENRFLKTLETGYSFVCDLSIGDHKILEYILASSPDPNRKFDPIFLYYDLKNQDYTFYNTLKDTSGTFTIDQFYLIDKPAKYDAYAVIRPKMIEDMEETDHPRRKMILDRLEENQNNPILALLKFK